MRNKKRRIIDFGEDTPPYACPACGLRFQQKYWEINAVFERQMEYECPCGDGVVMY